MFQAKCLKGLESSVVTLNSLSLPSQDQNLLDFPIKSLKSRIENFNKEVKNLEFDFSGHEVVTTAE